MLGVFGQKQCVSCSYGSRNIRTPQRSIGAVPRTFKGSSASGFIGNAVGMGSSILPARRDPATTRICAYKAEIPDRLMGSVPYLLPLFDGLRYGRFFLTEYPVFVKLIAPLFPLYDFYRSFPFASIIVFFGLYLGVIQNQSFGRFVRFNAMQALLIDILLVLPGVVESIFKPSLNVMVLGYNTVWLYVFICVIYGIGACLMGESPRLPLVADAADAQIRR